ncbi:hypothetical protein [Thalassococcus sp. S3]|uniref:hypothetical protein n=1 Tax=Thalassococcus sp. S3 TaxID=2017482 RepID=UPI00102437C5|nr:hypothetical protein [Thalassococcus sp. S3]QBF33398.1 hypothetical protein CFI11_19600 [Thalassococcus sp. S3]
MGIKIPIVSDVIEGVKDFAGQVGKVAGPLSGFVPGAQQVNTVAQLISSFDTGAGDREVDADAIQQRQANQNLKSMLYSFDVT